MGFQNSLYCIYTHCCVKSGHLEIRLQRSCDNYGFGLRFFSIFAYSEFIPLPVITEVEVNISSAFSVTFGGNDKLVALSDINTFQTGLKE